MITVTDWEKGEWSRFATAAYTIRRNDIGHRFSAAAALPNGARISTERYDALMRVYRRWLCFNEYPPLGAAHG